jgi:hemoglobin
MQQPSAQKTLYERLGGVYPIATVVDDIVDRIMADPRINANPHVAEAHRRILPAGFKYLVTEMISQAAGGSQCYSGRSMRESHKDLRITPQEWLAFVDDTKQALNRFNVPQKEQQELLALVESTREDIVASPVQQTP